MEAWKEELYHHGILGMKWGKKNGPPYPLDASDHSVSEKKAGWRKSLNGGSSARQRYRERKRVIQDRYDKEEARIEAPYKRGEYLSEKDMERQRANEKRYDDEWAKAKRQYKEERKAERKGLTDKQKKALKIGVAVAGAVAVAYGAYKLSNIIGDKNQAINKRIADTIAKNANANYESIMNANFDKAYQTMSNDEFDASPVWKISEKLKEKNDASEKIKEGIKRFNRENQRANYYAMSRRFKPSDVKFEKIIAKNPYAFPTNYLWKYR